MVIPFQSQIMSLAVGVFLGGYVGVKIVWTAKKKAEMRMITNERDKLKQKGEIREVLIQTKDVLIADHNATIIRQVSEINGYATANSNLALSRAGTREVIYKTSAATAAQEIRNDSENPINYCLGINVNQRMLAISNAYRTGFPTEMSTSGNYVLAGG